MYVKELFFLNTRRPIRCVNASYGSEWFRMYLDEPHVLDPTQFPASFITLFTDSLPWHGNRVLTQTVWEHMSIKYNGGYSSSRRVCSHSRLSVSMCGYMCHPRRLPLPLTCSCHQSLHAHVCVFICIFSFCACVCTAICETGVFGIKL